MDFPFVFIESFCYRCYRGGATSEYLLKIGVFAPTGPVDPVNPQKVVSILQYSSLRNYDVVIFVHGVNNNNANGSFGKYLRSHVLKCPIRTKLLQYASFVELFDCITLMERTFFLYTQEDCNIGNTKGIYYVTMLIGDYHYIGFITYFVAPSVRVSYNV